MLRSPVSSFTLGTTRLFAEATPAATETTTDIHGFIEKSPLFFSYEQFIDRPCSLVVAPPWTGKSFVARRIQAAFREQKAVHLTDFATWESGDAMYPQEWDTWLSSARQLVWIIDALEEAQHKQLSVWPRLKRQLASLPAEPLQRLRLLIFARDGEINEVAPTLENDLNEIFHGEFFKARLLSLDAANAYDLLLENTFDREDWTRVCETILHSKLQAVAGFPAALLHLAKSRPPHATSERAVWRGVLQNTLDEHAAYRERRFLTEPEERFAAAARIAAVLTLSGNDGLQVTPYEKEPSLGQIFPFPPLVPNIPTRSAAAESLRSGMFRDGRRFLHRNVREWMAAFGLADLVLAKLRPIFRETTSSADTPTTIRAEFRDLAQLLNKVHDSPEVREWLDGALALMPPGDLFRIDLVQVKPLLDRMEQLAARGAWLNWLDEPESLRHLRVAGIDREIGGRVGDSTKATPARVLLLRLGSALRLEEVLQAAARFVADPSEDLEVRSWSASILRRSAREDLLRSLETWLEGTKPANREEKALISTLIASLIETRIWSPAKAFRSVPPGPAGEIIDATGTLPLVFERYLTADDALAIITDLKALTLEDLTLAAETNQRFGERQDHPQFEIVAAAVRMLAEAEPANDEWLRLLIPFALTLVEDGSSLHTQIFNTLRTAFRSSEPARRELFEATVALLKLRSEPDADPWLYQLLTPDDLPWLEERLIEFAKSVPGLWAVALNLAQQSSIRRAKTRVRRMVREHAPQRLESFDTWRRRERAQQTRAARERRNKEQRQRHIADVDRELLEVDIEAKHRLRDLSWINFSSPQSRPRNLIGQWDDVPADLQQKILGFCITALDSVEPTAIPEGSSFPTGLLYEAQAFLAISRLCPDRFRLSPERVRRWLPSVLMAITEDKRNILEQCHAAASDATEGVVLDAVCRELNNDSAYSVVLQDLPEALWTARTTEWVVHAARSGQPVSARSSLLELLASRRPDAGRKLASEILDDLPLQELGRLQANSRETTDDRQPIMLTALDVLLALDAEFAWPRFRAAASAIGRPFLERLRGLTDNARFGLRVQWKSWPAQRLGDFAALLLEQYPPDEDPIDEGGWVTRASELRQLRWRILEYLVYSDQPDTAIAVERVKRSHPQARKLADRLIASREARELKPTSALQNPVGISVEDACRLLDEQHFRIVRSEEDLLEVVTEVLDRIARDLSDDLALFYCRSGKGIRRRHEESLQIYVRRRLDDHLKGKVLDRETLVKRGRRTDIRVLARVAGTDEFVRLVVEVKWSDNSDRKRGVSTGIRQQLGREYLVEEGLGCGIYLVGWNGRLGTWHAGSPQPAPEPKALQQALEVEACDLARENPGVKVRPLVWDLDWKGPEPAASTSIEEAT